MFNRISRCDLKKISNRAIAQWSWRSCHHQKHMGYSQRMGHLVQRAFDAGCLAIQTYFKCAGARPVFSVGVLGIICHLWCAMRVIWCVDKWCVLSDGGNKWVSSILEVFISFNSRLMCRNYVCDEHHNCYWFIFCHWRSIELWVP